MKKISLIHVLLILGCMACVANLSAQSNLGAGGASTTTASGSISFSVGQVAYTTSANANGSAARGVQQSYPELEIRVPEQADAFDFILYPNPNRGTAFLHLPEARFAAYTLHIHDLGGRQVAVQTLSGGVSQLDLSTFASGAYTAQLYAENAYLAHFIIMKTN